MRVRLFRQTWCMMKSEHAVPFGVSAGSKCSIEYRIVVMGKWQRGSVAPKKKAAGPSGIGFSPQKKTGGPAKVICCRYAGVAKLFVERGGRGILQEADETWKLFGFFFVPGDTQPLLHKFTECLRQFMEEQGEVLETFCEANSVKFATSNGWDPMRLGMVNFSRAAYMAVPPDDMGPVKNMILFFDDFLRWRFAKISTKTKAVEWIVPSDVQVGVGEMECPGVSIMSSDAAVKSALCESLHGFEGPSGPRHLVLLVEFVDGLCALTLHGDGYPHRASLHPFQQVRERTDGSKEYSYSTGLIPFGEAVVHEILGEAIQQRLVLMKPLLTVEEMPSIVGVQCWNALCGLPNVLGEEIALSQAGVLELV